MLGVQILKRDHTLVKQSTAYDFLLTFGPRLIGNPEAPSRYVWFALVTTLKTEQKGRAPPIDSRPSNFEGLRVQVRGSVSGPEASSEKPDTRWVRTWSLSCRKSRGYKPNKAPSPMDLGQTRGFAVEGPSRGEGAPGSVGAYQPRSRRPFWWLRISRTGIWRQNSGVISNSWGSLRVQVLRGVVKHTAPFGTLAPPQMAPYEGGYQNDP